MRHRKYLIYFCLLLASMSIMADEPTSPEAGSRQQGESSIRAYARKDGCGVLDATNVRFSPTSVGDGARSIRLILRETFEQHQLNCTDGGLGKVSVEATAYGDDYKKGTKLWSFSTEGWTGEEYNDSGGQFYKVSMFGCCAASNTDVYFSLLNGKQLFASTLPLFQIDLVKGDAIVGQVFVGMQDNMSSLDKGFADAAGSKDAIAVLYMGSDTEPAESIVVHRTADDACHSDTLKLMVDGKPARQGYIETRHELDQLRFRSEDAPKTGLGVFLEGGLSCLDHDNDLIFDIPIVGGHLDALDAKSADPKLTFTSGKPVKQ